MHTLIRLSQSKHRCNRGNYSQTLYLSIHPLRQSAYGSAAVALVSIAAVATVSVAAAASAVVGVHLIMFGGLFSTIVEISHSSVAVKLKQSWQSF